MQESDYFWPGAKAAAEKPERKQRYWAIAAIVLTWVLWGWSLALPVWDTRSERTGDWAVVQGALPAVIGFLGIIVKCPAWYANLLLIPLCITLYKRAKGGFVLSLIALGVAASAYMMPGIYGDDSEQVIMGRLVGFYIWLGSFAVMALAHAFLVTPREPKWIATRVGIVLLMVVCIGGLEKICKVGVSPLETALKNPYDLTAFTTALSRNPSQAEKDAALWWAMRGELAENRSEPSQRITMLLAAGANPNMSYKTSDPLLFMAVRNEAFIKVLLQAGANVNARDSWGNTVLDVAKKSYASPECLQILEKAGARSSDGK